MWAVTMGVALERDMCQASTSVRRQAGKSTSGTDAHLDLTSLYCSRQLVEVQAHAI